MSKCKHGSRRAGLAALIATYKDETLMATIGSNRKCFVKKRYPHWTHMWRQIYLAEARKRGLL